MARFDFRWFVFSFLMAMGSISLHAEDKPVPRSSHPRGFASDAPLPAMTAHEGKTHAGNVTTPSSPTSSANHSTPSAQQAGAGGVNVSGNTRIGARAQGAAAAAVGQQNAAGNRVGTIGGK